MLLAEPEKYKNSIDATKREIHYMPIEFKINLNKKILPSKWKAKNIKINQENLDLFYGELYVRLH